MIIIKFNNQDFIKIFFPPHRSHSVNQISKRKIFFKDYKNYQSEKYFFKDYNEIPMIITFSLNFFIFSYNASKKFTCTRQKPAITNLDKSSSHILFHQTNFHRKQIQPSFGFSQTSSSKNRELETYLKKPNKKRIIKILFLILFLCRYLFQHFHYY